MIANGCPFWSASPQLGGLVRDGDQVKPRRAWELVPPPFSLRSPGLTFGGEDVVATNDEHTEAG
jgi:hypothetical protein